MWIGLFGLFAEGFHFLKTTIPEPVTHDETARAVFSIFFVSLSFMLVLSTAIILYGSLFRSAEVRFLFSLPARIERVFLHKFQEAILFSSWGFLLLGSPMLAAYGVVEGGSWYYYLAIIPFMLSFVYIPGGLGALLVLIIVRWLPGNRRRLSLAGRGVGGMHWRSGGLVGAGAISRTICSRRPGSRKCSRGFASAKRVCCLVGGSARVCSRPCTPTGKPRPAVRRCRKA